MYDVTTHHTPPSCGIYVVEGTYVLKTLLAIAIYRVGTTQQPFYCVGTGRSVLSTLFFFKYFFPPEVETLSFTSFMIILNVLTNLLGFNDESAKILGYRENDWLHRDSTQQKGSKTQKGLDLTRFQRNVIIL